MTLICSSWRLMRQTSMGDACLFKPVSTAFTLLPSVSRIPRRRNYAAESLPKHQVLFPVYNKAVLSSILALDIPTFKTFEARLRNCHLRLENETAETLYACIKTWHDACRRGMINNPRLLDGTGVTERDFNMTHALIPQSVITGEEAVPSQNSRVAWMFTVGMSIYAAAKGYEPAILTLANMYFTHRKVDGLGQGSEQWVSVMNAAKAIARRGDNADALTLMALRTLNVESKYEAQEMLESRYEAQEMLERALQIGDSTGEFEWRPRALVQLGRLIRAGGDLPRARELFKEAATKYRTFDAYTALASSMDENATQTAVEAAILGVDGACLRVSDMMYGAAIEAQEQGDHAAFHNKQVLAKEWKRLSEIKTRKDFENMRKRTSN